MREGIIGAVFFYLTGYSLVVLAYVKFNDLEFSGPANYQSIIALTTLLGTIWLFIGIIIFGRAIDQWFSFIFHCSPSLCAP